MKTTTLLTGFFFCVVISSGTISAKPPIETKEIAYQAGDQKMTGFVARPKVTKSDTPSVLVVHEWWGQTEYPRKRAKMLAELGYIAMAVDMYGDRAIAEHPKDAGAFAKKVMSDSKIIHDRFEAALNALLKEENVSSNKLAAIGYCFGGSVVLEMAKQGVNLKGVVSFHGGLMTPTPAAKDKVKAQILVLNGAEDKMASEEMLDKFTSNMKSAGVNFEVVNYPGAKHGFTNPEASKVAKKYKMPVGYNAEADKKSWLKMKDFLAKIFAN